MRPAMVSSGSVRMLASVTSDHFGPVHAMSDAARPPELLRHQSLRLRPRANTHSQCPRVLPPNPVQTREDRRLRETRGESKKQRATPLMAALQDSASKDRAAKRSRWEDPGGGGELKQKRARSLGVDAGGGGGSSAPATAPASASRTRPESAAASLVDVTVEDIDALDCGVCFLPLKPPIFQCDVGHVVCSLCRDKLQATRKCHVCGIATGSYRRCHDMERLVESIRVPCSYAAHGCTLRPAYYDQESHRSMCAHAPCHCPGEACSFVGSTTKLLDHFSTTHKWPCITTVEPDANRDFTISLHDGFNFLLADCSTGNKNKGDTASVQCLLMLTMERQQHARSISVHWIDPHAAGPCSSQGETTKEMQCNFWYSLITFPNYLSKSIWLVNHYQSSKFRVARTNLSNGLPKPDECFQVVVPNSAVGDVTGIQVRVRIDIN